jgi:hypothetical protein
MHFFNVLEKNAATAAPPWTSLLSMVYILDFYLYVLVHHHCIISNIVIFIGYYKFDFHLYIVACLIYLLYGTYTRD